MNRAERDKLREIGSRKRCATCIIRHKWGESYCEVMNRVVDRDELACLEHIHHSSIRALQLALF